MVDQKAQPIEDKLRQAWRQQRRFYNLRGISRFLIWLVLLIAVDFLIDWGIFFQLRMTARLGVLLLVCNVVVLAWVLWNDWLRYLRPFDPLLVALDVEDLHPELASLLVSYTQLEGPDAKQPDVSIELIEAMRQEAVSFTVKLDFREIVNFGQLKKLFAVATCIVVLFGVASLNNQEHFKALVNRLIAKDTPYPTRTNIDKISENIMVRVGDSAEVVVNITGVVPDRARLFIKPIDNSSGWTNVALDKTDRTFRYKMLEVVKDWKYYVRIGDAQSDSYQITVVAAPQIVDTNITLDFPKYLDSKEYTDPGSRQDDQLSLDVPEGTSLTWRLSYDRPIKELKITKTGTDQRADDETADAVTATLDSDGQTATFTINDNHTPFAYILHCTVEETGREFVYTGIEYDVRVRADTAPEVDLKLPRANGRATTEKTFTVVAQAKDDHGLNEAWLVYWINNDKQEAIQQEPIKIPGFGGLPRQRIEFPWKIKDSIKDLEPGTVVSFAVQVNDYHPDFVSGDRRTLSAKRTFDIVSQEGYKQWFDARIAAQTDEIKRVRDNELLSLEQVLELKKQEAAE